VDPAITARAWRRWHAVLTVGGLTLGIAVGALLVATALVLRTADTNVLVVTLTFLMAGVFTVVGIAFTVARAVLGRRGVWGPPSSWGVDRSTKRRIAAALREGSPCDEETAELAASEAEYTRRLGLLPASAWIFAALAQFGALLLVDPSGVVSSTRAGANVELGLLLLGLRLTAILFCGAGGGVALVTLARARRYVDGS
jgi:hypothetical protein